VASFKVVKSKVIYRFLVVAHDDKRGSVQRCLWDEAVGRRDPQQAGDKRRDSKEEEVPVESGWLPERKLGALGDEGLRVSVCLRWSAPFV
jgi:hypothetical protein